MHSSRFRARPEFSRIFAAGSFAGILIFSAGCISFFRADDKSELRLIFDAGSSGTRLCLYRVERSGGSCRALDARGFEECRPIPSKDGLARLGPALSRDVIDAGLHMLDAQTRARISSSALLGTGGFREKTEAQQLAVLDAVDEAMKKGGLKGRSAVLTGEEEALLAWDTVRQVTGSVSHTTLETGGATVQIASGQNQASKAISAPIGMNQVREVLQKDPAFGSACEKGNYDVCRALVLKRIADSPIRAFVAQLSAEERRRPLYGLGTPWRIVFQSAGKETLTIEEIHQLGRQKCLGPEGRRECFLFAYQGALIQSAGGSGIRDGRESWPRGAAASARFFPDCSDRR